VVSRASLHNFHFMRKMLLLRPKNDGDGGSVSGVVSGLEDGREGLKLAREVPGSVVGVRRGVSVLVSRAGDVIPQVMKRVFEDEGEVEFGSADNSTDDVICLEVPDKCPACGSPTSFDFVSLPKKKKKKKQMATKKSTKKNQPDNESDPLNDETVAQESAAIANIDEGESDDAESGQVLRCTGPQLLCQPRAVNALTYAYSRAGLDVKGLSKSKLGHLMEEGIIRFPSDLFTTFGSKNDENTTRQEEMLNKIAELPGWGVQSSQNLAESVQSVASGGITLSRYIYSLGIPLVGTQASQLVAAAYGDVDSFLKALKEASTYEESDEESDDESSIPPPFAALTGDDGSEKVKGIGPTAIAALLSFSKEEVLMKAATDLENVLTIHDDSSQKTSGISIKGSGESNQKPLQFEGMTVVFTGALPGMSRTVAQNTVKELGAKATPNMVSKSTTLVVEGDKGGKKVRQARELGIRVIDFTEFSKLIGE